MVSITTSVARDVYTHTLQTALVLRRRDALLLWLLVVGCWLLVVGCWLLVSGCWLLNANHHYTNNSYLL